MSESEMNGSNSSETKTISESVAVLIDAASGTYFHLLRNPLPASLRFFYAWLGSATLFAHSVLGLRIGVLEETQAVHITQAHVPGKAQFLYIVLSIIHGWLIASAVTRHGAVRLYLSGLFLSAFVFSLFLQ